MKGRCYHPCLNTRCKIEAHSATNDVHHSDLLSGEHNIWSRGAQNVLQEVYSRSCTHAYCVLSVTHALRKR